MERFSENLGISVILGEGTLHGKKMTQIMIHEIFRYRQIQQNLSLVKVCFTQTHFASVIKSRKYRNPLTVQQFATLAKLEM